METNCFNHYKVMGKKIDNKLKKLTKIWESPLYLYRLEKNNEETAANLNNLTSLISDVQEDLKEDTKNRYNYLNDMDKFLQDCQTIYNDIEQGVNDIECLFSEYELSRPSSGLDEKLNALSIEEIDNLNISLRSNSIEQINEEDKENCSFNDANELSANDLFITPLRGCPQEPIFSPYYYSKH